MRAEGPLPAAAVTAALLLAAFTAAVFCGSDGADADGAEWTVTFDLNYPGSEPTVLTVADAATVSAPEDPVRDGFAFNGWYETRDGQTGRYDWNNPVIEDLVLKARWVQDTHLGQFWSLTINTNYTGGDADLVDWDWGDGSEHTVTGDDEPADGRATHKYASEGEYRIVQTCTKGETGRTVAVFVIEIMGYPIIHYDADGDGVPETDVRQPLWNVAVSEDSAPSPERDGFAFLGWFSDPECTAPFDFSAAVTEPINVYSKWAPVSPSPGGDTKPAIRHEAYLWAALIVAVLVAAFLLARYL